MSSPTFSRWWIKVPEILGDIGNLCNFQCHFLVVYIMFLSGDIGPQSCHWAAKSSKIAPQIVGPKFLQGGRLKNVYDSLLPWFTPTMWQSLVKFCGLKCVCKAWQWRKMQNFQRVGENSGQILSHLWTKVRVSFGRCRPLLPLSCKISKKGGFGVPICRGREYLTFWTCVFKSHMWSILVEYRSASLEIRRRKNWSSPTSMSGGLTSEFEQQQMLMV